MSLLYRVFFAWKCTSTHHKLALDALRHLRGDTAEAWQNLFLSYIDPYLEGSKAPDVKFKDFKNHVIHVRENYWGGAVAATEKWYQQTVEALAARKWKTAVYNAGVMSHYYTDPIQPFHTGQSEEEAIIHRAVEWSITKSYDQLQQSLEQELGGYPKLEAPKGPDWLARMVRQGAETANPHYDVIVDHYNFEKGVKDPPAGLDQEIKDRVARLIGYASVGLARILERAIEEAGVEPPKCSVSVAGAIEQMTIPLFWVTRKLADAKDRAMVEAIYREYQETGKVLAALPEDEKTIRRLHAEEVSKIPLVELDKRTPHEIGAKHGTGTPARGVKPAEEPTAAKKPPAKPAETTKPAARPPEPAPTLRKLETPAAVKRPEPAPVKSEASILRKPEPVAEDRVPRFYLELDAPVVDAPSIGPKTAARLNQIGVQSVADLLREQPEALSRRMAMKHIEPQTVREWQAQSRLMLRVPGLRGHDAQMIVGCGIREPEQLAAANPEHLLADVEAFLLTGEADRILRSGQAPDLGEVRNWVQWAKSARTLRAA